VLACLLIDSRFEILTMAPMFPGTPYCSKTNCKVIGRLLNRAPERPLRAIKNHKSEFQSVNIRIECVYDNIKRH